jgi:hypothetical protein
MEMWLVMCKMRSLEGPRVGRKVMLYLYLIFILLLPLLSIPQYVALLLPYPSLYFSLHLSYTPFVLPSLYLALFLAFASILRCHGF